MDPENKQGYRKHTSWVCGYTGTFKTNIGNYVYKVRSDKQQEVQNISM